VPAPSYIIAATPRSGSYFLCELLANTDLCGYPAEYVLDEDEHIWRECLGCSSREEYLDHFLRRGWSKNRVFGAKLTWRQFTRFAEDLLGRPCPNDAELARSIAHVFGGCGYIFLRRHDRLRQAISYHRALASQRWTKSSEGDDVPHPAEVFDADAIDRLMRAVELDDARWREYLDQTRAVYLTVYYEDLVSRPAESLANILAFLGVPFEPARPFRPGRLRRQADSVTERWIERFRATCPGAAPHS
jgi:LPS sulfotransferase NodH